MRQDHAVTKQLGSFYMANGLVEVREATAIVYLHFWAFPYDVFINKPKEPRPHEIPVRHLHNRLENQILGLAINIKLEENHKKAPQPGSRTGQCLHEQLGSGANLHSSFQHHVYREYPHLQGGET